MPHDRAKTAPLGRVEDNMVLATVILLTVCIAPGNYRRPADADFLQPNLGGVRYLRNIINDARLQPCHSPHRPGELAAALSFDDQLFRSVERM